MILSKYELFGKTNWYLVLRDHEQGRKVFVGLENGVYTCECKRFQRYLKGTGQVCAHIKFVQENGQVSPESKKK